MSAPAILSRQVELLYRNLPVGQLVSIVNASLLAWLWRGSVGTAAATAWWLAAVAVALGRLLVAHAFRHRPRAVDNAAPWLRRSRIGAGAGGLAWAAGALLFMLQGDTLQEVFTAFVMAGMVAGAVPVLAADRLAFRLYAWPIVLTTGLAAVGLDPLHLTFSLMAMVYLWGSTQAADHFNSTLLDSLRLEREKDALAAKLDLARQAAEDSGRAKTEFLANISHELRTPMNGIMGMAELLAMEDLSAAQQDMLQPLRQSADDLLRLIDNLIELSALEAGHIEACSSPFAAGEMLSAFMAPPARAAQAKGLAFEQDTDPLLPPILVGDVTRLSRTLSLLTDNAVKFTDRGTVRVATHVQEKTADGVRVEFIVSDTGIGIPPDKLAAIFGSFTQGDGSSTRRHAGVGIGLPLCCKLTELMRGSLTVDSQPGAGSTFRLSLPFGLPTA